MSRTPTGRRRGGQPRNHNRLKHGLYARQLPVRTLLRLEARGLNRNELQIALARARLKSLLDKQAAASPRDFLSYERGILHYLEHITTLIHRNQALAQQAGIASHYFTELVDWLED
jgi:hypothetical protein